MTGFQPEGWRTVTPRLFTADVAGLVAFLRAVFNAKGDTHPDRPAEITIGDSTLMVSDGGGVRGSASAFLYVYVPDVDQAHAKAVGLGAEVIEEPSDQFYGDRRSMIKDAWGNTWQIATPSDRQ